jgi:hypothetical protein
MSHLSDFYRCHFNITFECHTSFFIDDAILGTLKGCRVLASVVAIRADTLRIGAHFIKACRSNGCWGGHFVTP